MTLPASAVQAISTPEIGFPKASVTCTTSGPGRAAPAGADWLSPATATNWLASEDTASNRSGADSTRSPPAVATRTSAAAAPTRVPSTTWKVGLAAVVGRGGVGRDGGAARVAGEREGDARADDGPALGVGHPGDDRPGELDADAPALRVTLDDLNGGGLCRRQAARGRRRRSPGAGATAGTRRRVCLTVSTVLCDRSAGREGGERRKNTDGASAPSVKWVTRPRLS